MKLLGRGTQNSIGRSKKKILQMSDFQFCCLAKLIYLHASHSFNPGRPNFQPSCLSSSSAGLREWRVVFWRRMLLHRLTDLNIWSPFGGDVWACWEGVLEEERHWAGLSEYKTKPFVGCSLCFMPVGQAVSLLLRLPCLALPWDVMGSCGSGATSPDKAFLRSLVVVSVTVIDG